LVEGSNLGGLKFAFFFAKKLVWPEYERVETTLGDLLKNEKDSWGFCNYSIPRK